MRERVSERVRGSEGARERVSEREGAFGVAVL